MRINYYFFIIIYLISFSNNYSQNLEKLQRNYTENINSITDSSISFNKLNLDSALLQMDTAYGEMNKGYFNFRDSVYSVYLKSLNIYRKDSVIDMSEILKNSFDTYYKHKLDSLNVSYMNFVKYLNTVKESNSTCDECREKSDFDDKLDDYRDLLDSLSGIFQDESSVLADTLSSMCDDSLQGCKDSLISFTENLIDNQNEEKEILTENEEKGYNEENERKSEIDIDLTYISHESYRGRDNGYNQNSVTPNVQFIHNSGFGVFADVSYLSKSNSRPDDYDIGISYNSELSDIFSLDLSYTHFWFSTSSTQIRSSLNNNIDGVLSLNTDHYNLSLTLDIDFGSNVKEISATLNNGFPITLAKHFLNGSLTFEPGLILIYGEQNSTLIQRRRNRKGVIVRSTKVNSTFGIMDYELDFPLTYESNHLIVKPFFYLTAPVNVLDLSTKTSYGVFSLEITVPFKF